MVHASGRLHIGGTAYFVWADPPNGGYTAQRPVDVHRGTSCVFKPHSSVWCRDRGAWSMVLALPAPVGGGPSTSAPQARGVHGLHRHVESPQWLTR